jgi:hypothetical protein
MTIKILRFKDGLDIVCSCNVIGDTIEIEDAMLFEIRGINLAMQHWAPVAIMKESKIHISREDVLCFFEPSDEFVDYYSETIQKMKTAMDNLKNKKENDMEELFNAITEKVSKGNFMH